MNTRVIRLLDSAEYERLAYVEEGYVPDPDSSLALVVEEEGKIVGRMMLIPMYHIEGTWIEQEHRGGQILARMMKHMEDAAKSKGLTKLLSYATPEVESYIERLGYTKQQLTVWAKDI